MGDDLGARKNHFGDLSAKRRENGDLIWRRFPAASRRCPVPGGVSGLTIWRSKGSNEKGKKGIRTAPTTQPVTGVRDSPRAAQILSWLEDSEGKKAAMSGCGAFLGKQA